MIEPPNISVALRYSDPQSIETAQLIRSHVNQLLFVLEHGSWDDSNYEEFWSLCRNAGINLSCSNPQLSERAGLAKSFFTTVAGSRVRAKPDTIRKALKALVAVADERLYDVDLEKQKNAATSLQWQLNPHLKNTDVIERTQDLLLQLVEQLKHSNSLHEIAEIDNHFRRSTIELLETVIALLKAPLVERTLFERTANTLKSLTIKVSDHASAGFVGGLAGAGATAIIAFIK
jgi:hypothetical protein